MDYRSIYAVFRLRQLGFIILTIVYCVFLENVNMLLIKQLQNKNMKQYEHLYIRGEITKISGKPLCAFTNCACESFDTNYTSCIAIDQDTNYMSQGKCYDKPCESKIRGTNFSEICDYICEPADEIKYNIRFSQEPIAGDIWSTWLNATITTIYVRNSGFRSNELVNLQNNIYKTLMRPTQIWLHKTDKTIHWNMPITDGIIIIQILTLIKFVLIMISGIILVLWKEHIWGLISRRCKKQYADPNETHIV